MRVLDPIEVALERRPDSFADGLRAGRETIDDPSLAGWLFGPGWRAEQGSWVSRFRIVHPQPDAARAWFVPLTEVDPSRHAGFVGRRRRARSRRSSTGPGRWRWRDRAPDRADVAVDAEAPGWVLVTQLADPQWQAGWTDEAGAERCRRRSCRRSGGRERDGGWQRVRVPGPGRWTLHLEYQARDVREGLAISAVAWLAWGIALAISLPATEKEARVSGQVGVAIVGASGYAARELIRILLNHPRVAITAATSRQDESPRLDALHPSLTRRIDLACETFDADRIADRARFAFLALPHTASMAVVPDLRARDVRVIDLSADYRLTDPQVYADWYGHEHTDLDGLRTRRLRPAGAVSRPDPDGPADRQPGLLHVRRASWRWLP